MTTKPRFHHSYQGETTYSWRGARYRVRTHSRDYGYNGDYYEEGILPRCGAITCDGAVDKFPPAEILQHFAGYCLARWDPETREIVYRDGTPDIVPDPCGHMSGFVARAWLRTQADSLRAMIRKHWPDRRENPQGVRHLIEECRQYQYRARAAS